MCIKIDVKPSKTYATEANVVAAIDKHKFANQEKLRYFITRSEDGRFFPVFIGENAVTSGVHFVYNVVG